MAHDLITLAALGGDTLRLTKKLAAGELTQADFISRLTFTAEWHGKQLTKD